MDRLSSGEGDSEEMHDLSEIESDHDTKSKSEDEQQPEIKSEDKLESDNEIKSDTEIESDHELETDKEQEPKHEPESEPDNKDKRCVFFFKLHIIQSTLQIQLYTSLILGSAQLASLLITFKTKYGNNYRDKCKSRIKIMM